MSSLNTAANAPSREVSASTLSTAPLQATPEDRLTRAAWAATIAGFAASLVAIGLPRVAFTPLIPAIIEAHWFSPADTVSLGAALFAGYLTGALLGRPAGTFLGNRWALRLMMVLASASFFASAFPLSLSWYFAWRFLGGVSGGVVMILVASTVLPHIPAARRGFVSGMIFLGLGLGIAASGTLIPALLRLGLAETWTGLGILTLALTAISWFGWPDSAPPAPAGATTDRAGGAGALRILYVQYAANALGVAALFILLVDYIVRGLGLGTDVGAAYWVLVGVGATFGPLVGGRLGDRLGFAPAYVIVLALQAAALAALVLTGNGIAVGAAAIILGAFAPGIVPLALGRIGEILPGDPTAQRAAWSKATVMFAVFQALGGYGYAALFRHTGGSHQAAFLVAAVALTFAFVLGLATLPRRRARRVA